EAAGPRGCCGCTTELPAEEISNTMNNKSFITQPNAVVEKTTKFEPHNQTHVQPAGSYNPDWRYNQMLVTMRQSMKRDSWLRFCDVCTARGQSVAGTLRTLIQRYIDEFDAESTSSVSQEKGK